MTGKVTIRSHVETDTTDPAAPVSWRVWTVRNPHGGPVARTTVWEYALYLAHAEARRPIWNLQRSLWNPTPSTLEVNGL